MKPAPQISLIRQIARNRWAWLLAERMTWAFGLVCLVMWGALYVDGIAGTRHELERFAMLQAAALQQPPRDHTIEGTEIRVLSVDEGRAAWGLAERK